MRSTLVHPWMIHPHTGAPLRALGTRRDGRPIWPVMGASEDDDPEADPDDDPEADPDDDPEADPDEDIDEGKTLEDVKAELIKVRRSRAKLLKEARNRTKSRDKDTTKDTDGKDAFTKDDVEALREETRESVRSEMLPAVIRPAARTLLEGLGMAFPKDADVAKAKLSRALKLADIDDVELDEDGELVGLEQALREVRRQFPEMFKGTRVRSPGNAGGGRRPSTKAKSATELQMAAAFGKDIDDD